MLCNVRVHVLPSVYTAQLVRQISGPPKIRLPLSFHAAAVACDLSGLPCRFDFPCLSVWVRVLLCARRSTLHVLCRRAGPTLPRRESAPPGSPRLLLPGSVGNIPRLYRTSPFICKVRGAVRVFLRHAICRYGLMKGEVFLGLPRFPSVCA